MEIGFIGLGVQGGPIAQNIVRANHVLTVHDKAPSAMEAFSMLGARPAANAREVAAASDIVAICVQSDAQVRDVMLGADGVLEGVRKGTIVVLHSTISAETIPLLGKATLKARAVLLDAPVSGGAQGAIARTLSFMVGGDVDAVGVCTPLFKLSGESIVHTGALGTATIAKLAHQAVMCGTIAAMAEGVRLGQAAGIPLTVLKAVFAAGWAQSRAADTWGEFAMAPHAIPLLDKDLKEVLALAARLEVAMPFAAMVRPLLADILPDGTEAQKGR